MRQMELQPAYEVAAAPADAVLTAEDLHAQLRIDSDDENPLIEAYIAAATETVETDARLYLRPVDLVLRLDAWPDCGPVLLERCPVNALGDVTYIDGNGDEQTWDPEEYASDLVSRPARLYPAYGISWPVARCQPGAIAIELECGFAEGTVPEVALQMIRLLVGHWFENRETVAVGSITKEIEFAYTRLLERLAW